MHKLIVLPTCILNVLNETLTTYCHMNNQFQKKCFLFRTDFPAVREIVFDEICSLK